ncbi:ATP-binding protein involved in chromosome partitioning [Cyclonatronum proteinivorum]|uniref:Iron-sulfur cluster carrier protein n=1 Tax=Cyclonatronum proteinivorum TaxID=1457365 RepID=A0A345UNJ8_9BACT|nr:Mrp/NBP35 family ATP-binding protein [Cyclonatronum proteinivorum]AXJ02050.1 ATP-binding protein involved in chromosome partitioning [Cyclonatronum proteinivorum]
MSITSEKVLEALGNVIDPDLNQDIVSLNMVEDIQIEGKKVSFTVNLTTPACPMKEQIQRACVNAVKHLVDAEAEVVPNMSSKVQQNKKIEETQTDTLSGVKNIIAVASGKGGVGKSTVSVNLAVALAQTGAKVGLVDTDIYGPSIPTMFNVRERPNINTRRKLIPLEKFGVKLLSMGLLVDQDQAVVWRGPMVSSAVKQFLSEADWGELDYLLMDLPPGTGDIQLTIVQTVPLTGAIIVSTPQDVALDDARKGVAMFQKVNVPVLGIIENMAYFTPPDMPDRKYHIFGKDGARNLAEKLDVPFLGEVPLEQTVREGADEGVPAVAQDDLGAAAISFKEIANRSAQQISIRNAMQDPTEKIEIKFK